MSDSFKISLDSDKLNSTISISFNDIHVVAEAIVHFLKENGIECEIKVIKK